MSDRYALTQQQALKTQLEQLIRRVDAMERRQRWNGAVQFVRDLTDYPLVVGSPVESVELECAPGRWHFVGYGVVIITAGTRGSSTVETVGSLIPYATVQATLLLDGAVMGSPTTSGGLDAAAYTQVKMPVVITSAEVFDDTTTVTLQLSHVAGAGVHADVQVIDQYLTAIPC